jgi:dTDP-4-amino-4,6-dideoxygalactose transaminase
VASRKPKVIRLSKSCLSIAEKTAVMGVLDREFLGMGVEVKQFEEMLSVFFGRPAVCVSTGTAALHLALQAAGIGPDDEVLVQSLTYVASFQAISATGAKPVACSVDSESLCLDWQDAEKRLTSRTKAIMPVHYAGGVGALEDIYAFAKKNNLRVIEDAAHAFGTVYQDNKIGSFGDIACFSFDGIKNITSGEGGCVVTDDKEIIQKIRNVRLLGVENDTEKRFLGERSWDFDVMEQGWRYHMSNIMAAIGIEQLKRFPVLAQKRQKLAQHYDDFFKNTKIKIIQHDYNKVVPHIYALQLPEKIDKKAFINYLSSKGIQTGVHYKPSHQLSLYRNDLEEIKSVDKIYKLLVSIPLHPDLSHNDVAYIIKKIKDIL